MRVLLGAEWGRGMASSAEMGIVEVSPEMLTLLGAGDVGGHRWPPRSVAFELDDKFELTFHARPDRSGLARSTNLNRLILIVDRSACERVNEGPIDFDDGATYILPTELRAIALALRDCAMPEAAAVPYRLAKSIELLCEILRARTAGEILTATSADFTFADCRRIAAARQLIDERWDQPLSLSELARHTGVNRSKLSRGFRALYGCSI
jgi:AraC family transcriptional regulator, transcriptional activator of the genes for pyochelin and ferripyochelin receptors